MDNQTTPRLDWVFTRHKSFRRVYRLEEKDDLGVVSPEDLASCSIILYISPIGAADFTITTAGPADKKLFLEPATTLNGALTNNATSATVVDASNMARKGYVKIDSEIIYYASRTNTQLNGLLRGQAGTTGAAHNNGATVTAKGQIRVHISDEEVNLFTWTEADFRMQLVDATGNGDPLFAGYIRMEEFKA